MIRTAEAYHLKKKLADERKLVQKLQQQYWHLKNIEYVAMRLDEIERERKQQAQAQQEEAQS
jgi:hypothetical protein